MNPTAYFDRFVNQIIIEGRLVLDSPLHIGDGNKQVFGPDNSVVKTHDNQPYIPGSSLKGILRSFLERIAHTLPYDREAYAEPCQSVSQSDQLCLSQYRNKDARDQLLRQLDGDEERFQQTLARQSCPICHLFGNQLRAAKVKIRDATVCHPWAGQYFIRQGNAIDRDTGKAANRVLYDFEVIPAGTTFQFQLLADNLSKTEQLWLAVVLEALRQGHLTVGGKGARGLGHIHGEDWIVQMITGNELLSCLLGKSSPSQPFEDFLNELNQQGV